MIQLTVRDPVDIYLSEVRSQPTREVEHDVLVLMVEKNQEVALMGVQPKDPARAAQLCFDEVEHHSSAISALLGNDQVFQEVARTLRQMKDSKDPVEEKRAVAVAMAALAAGQAMDASSDDWPAAVRLMLRERWETSENYWRQKERKFGLLQAKDSSVVVPTSHKPFLSADPARLKEQFQFPVKFKGKEFAGFHFVQAFLDHSKAILKDLSKVNLSSLDFAQLDANSLKNFRGRSQTMVHVVPENFGKLLARLSSQVPNDGQRDFRGQCCLKGEFVKGQDMVVRLSKKSGDDPMMKVSVFIPCLVSGDTPHLKVLPETLHGLSFKDFDVSGKAGMELVDILCLDVGDRELAQALAGQFVPNTPDMNVSRVIHALSWGGAHEMRGAASELSAQGFEGLNSQAEALGGAVAIALHYENIEVLDELTRSPLLGKLDAKTLEAMVWAHFGGEMGFPLAIRSGRPEVVVAMGGLVHRVKDRLPVGVAEEVLFDHEVTVELLANEHKNVVMAYGGVIAKCLDLHAPSAMLMIDMPSIRRFLKAFELPVMRLLLQGMDLPPRVLDALLRGTQPELMWFLLSQRSESIRAVLELVIAVQTGDTRLEKGAASVLLREIRLACKQPRFLCCGPQVKSALFQTAIMADPELDTLLKQAEDSLKP